MTIVAVRPIETIAAKPPYTIVLRQESGGSALTDDEWMAVKVKWALKAGYQVLTRDIPIEFRPFNAVIRISARGTEDLHRDYLAQFAAPRPTPPPVRTRRF